MVGTRPSEITTELGAQPNIRKQHRLLISAPAVKLARVVWDAEPSAGGGGGIIWL